MNSLQIIPDTYKDNYKYSNGDCGIFAAALLFVLSDVCGEYVSTYHITENDDPIHAILHTRFGFIDHEKVGQTTKEFEKLAYSNIVEDFVSYSWDEWMLIIAEEYSWSYEEFVSLVYELAKLFMVEVSFSVISTVLDDLESVLWF